MAVLSKAQWAAIWVQEGGPPNQAAMYATVVFHESAGRTDAVNPQSGATGGPQIHPGGEQYKDPHVATRAAIAKWKAGGWTPWSVCGSGPWSAGTHDCARLKGEAMIVQASLPGDIWKGLGLNSPGGGGPGDPLNDPNQGGGNALGIDLSGITDALGNIARLIKGALQVIFQFLKKLSQQNTWIDAGKILLGLILLKMALSRLFQVAT